jgi:hypothetical protein
MEPWIEHVDEPARLILAWQAPDPEKDRLRWAVGELSRATGVATFKYFDGDEFTRLNSGRRQDELRAAGFRGYPAFDVLHTPSGEFSDGVLEAFLRRVPPRSRSDFPRYLEHFRLRSSDGIGPFALLAVTEAKLPSDGFSLIDPLDPTADRRPPRCRFRGRRPQALSGQQGWADCRADRATGARPDQRPRPSRGSCRGRWAPHRFREPFTGPNRGPLAGRAGGIGVAAASEWDTR